MDLRAENSLVCPKCHRKNFEIKKKATYVYTYNVDSNNLQAEILETAESPYLFDNREKVSESKYIVCKSCGESYSFFINKDDEKLTVTLI